MPGYDVWPSPKVMSIANFAVTYPEIYSDLAKLAAENKVSLDDYILDAHWVRPGIGGFNAAFYDRVTAEEYDRQRREDDGNTSMLGVPTYLWFSIEADVAEDGTISNVEIFDVIDGRPDGMTDDEVQATMERETKAWEEWKEKNASE